MADIKRMSSADAGCIFDSHRGHFIVPDVVRFAYRHGRPTDPFVVFALARYDDEYFKPTYPSEGMIEEADAATVWLNANLAPEGFAFDWNDGDYGLYEVDDEEA